MTFLITVSRSRWFRTFVGLAVLCTLIWFCGPLLGIGQSHPLETEIVRYVLIAALFMLWLVTNLLQDVRARRKDAKLAEGVAAAAAPDPAEKAAADEVALLSTRLRDALNTLRKSKLGVSRKRLATLPWYMFIGPPGAGKTTALLHCGLKFPLADEKGPTAFRGVGGTRNCDWWLTDDAVLIDTAGRYTTQDSQAEVDSAAWLGFLRLLKKIRRRQPLNGVLIAISLSDLSILTEEQRLAHAGAIRRRVRELQDELGVRLPAYVLFTKADLIAGFVEFFDDLRREEREQVWGVTFPMDTGRDEAGAIAAFLPEFDALLARLNDRMLERVHQETDVQRRRLIYGFPQQVASLREVAAEFLNECFQPNRLESRALLRGVYLTSGTQSGTPIDRLLASMAGEFGLPRQSVTAFSGSGRSYFLSRLVKDVVFGEAGAAGLDPMVERRTKWMHRGAYAACVLVLLVLGAAWLSSYVGNRELVAQVHAASATYNTQYAELMKRHGSDPDLGVVVPALNTLQDMRSGYGEQDIVPPIALTFGLYQGVKLGTAAVEGYTRALNGLLLPRLLARLEKQIASRLNNPDFLYQALKVYLVLGRQGPLDRDLVMQWFLADVLATYPSEEEATLRDALGSHVDAMLQQPLASIPLNQALVGTVRDILNKEPRAEFSYNRIMRSKRVQSIPPWTVAEYAEPGGGRVFQLKSGRSLDSGTPGIYTWAGYHNIFLLMLPTVTQDVAENAWVLGRPARDIQGSIKDAAKLRRDVLDLYLDDFTRRWDAILADISLVPFTNLRQGLDQLSLLSAPASPLRNLLVAIDAQTMLSRTGAADEAIAKAEARAARLGQRLSGFAAFEARSGLSIRQNELVGILSEAFGTDAGGKPIDPAKRVDDHFRALHDFVVGQNGRPPAMEQALQKLLNIYQNLNQAANGPNQGETLLQSLGSGGASANPAAQLQDLTRDMPRPIAAMLQSVPRSVLQVATSDASQELSDAWRSKVVPLCEAAFNRYPFVQSSNADVPIDDFAKLLGPGGMVEQFFDQRLKSFVDTTQRPWRWQSPDRAPLGVSLSSLAEFERAAQIRDALFSGGNQMQVRFQLVPVALDPQVGQISVEIAGQLLTNNHGPPEAMQFQWPGPNGKTLVRVTMTPAGAGRAMVTDNDGPWALLRVMDTARVLPSDQPDKFRIVFTGAGGTATFDLKASSVRNPFTMGALRLFRCPVKL